MHKNPFVQGPIPPGLLGSEMAKHQSKTGIGGHAFFLGQVRADRAGDAVVTDIDFSAYEEMALERLHVIREDAFAKWPLSCIHVYHSVGKVPVGSLCFLVLVSSAHRQACFESLPYIVDRFKAEVPVFGREIFSDGSDRWKKNTPSAHE